MADDPNRPSELPDSLRRQLDDFRRDLWRTKIAEALLAGFCGLLFSFLLVFVLDRIGSTPTLLRLSILIGGTSLAGIFAPIVLHRWVWRHRRENQLARLIAKRFPGLGDRLLGAIELQQQQENSDTLSPRLRAAAMQSVAEESAQRQLTAALPTSLRRRWLLALLSGLTLTIAAFSLAPQAGWNSLKRWLMPLSEAPRYTFTSLEQVPTEWIVPHGEPFEKRLRLSPDSEWQPAKGSARYGKQDPLTVPLHDRSYLFEFPAQQDPGIVRIAIGDARHSIRVTPSQRPSIRRTTATVKYPAYLQLPDREIDLGPGLLPVVRGSSVSVRVEATRPLAAAHFGPLFHEQQQIADGGPMLLSSNQASTPALEIGDQDARLPIRWTDQLGLDGDDGFEVRIDSLADEPPSVQLQGSIRQHVMLPEETIDLEILADDDFGIRRIGLEWSGEFTRASDGKPAKGELPLLRGGPSMPRLTSPAAFSPSAFGITPQKLVLRAWCDDYLPERPRTYSQSITLFILTRDEHAQMLKTRFDRAIGELEDLARRERGLYEENQRLEKLEPAELQNEETRERLKAQQDAEAQQAERMKELAESTSKLFKDSTRNGSIDKTTLGKIAEALESMRELADQDLPKIDQQLGAAQDEKNTAEKANEDVAKAVEKQATALEKMREAIERANEANERFEAGTFVNRLKKAASEERGIGTTLWESYERSAAAFTSELDPSDAGRLLDLVRQQSNTNSDIRWIQEDLGHFFTRTNKEPYRKVLDAMVDSKIDLALEDLRLTLDANQGFLAREATEKWADQLNEWAKLLQIAAQENSGGGGNGSSPASEDEDFEFMLRMMKMIQQEQDLRARTRALETLRRSLENTPSTKP
ncbi:MAG: hypothetical protein EAZ65_06355 [Verrucomicrobia bacterium]|nr:MAG: hypothetical protein EAZ84_11645 [Verrucomicrobiota bacterium]TAE87656.1 MAG: hypothetical protein EAZ82_06780 [Verrucomicrobiota bacterium]TAF25409.1 MAG: hypothetical protein EAZ71_07965 [Verrucomicrobiota bacterium]TAF41196.1 MAG: hypothetical protein EAZ65_06355 [Verrucomicrobiota bacterium]